MPTETTSTWWLNAVGGREEPRDDDQPQPGYYRRRFVRKGPYVPVHIWRETVGTASALFAVAGATNERYAQGMSLDPYKIWTSVEPISPNVFNQLMAYTGQWPHESWFEPVKV